MIHRNPDVRVVSIGERGAPTAAVQAIVAERPDSTLKSHSWPTPADSLAGQGADIRAGLRYTALAGSHQFVEQRFCLFEIGRVEAFGEPAVDGAEKITRFGVAALDPPHPQWRRAIYPSGGGRV